MLPPGWEEKIRAIIERFPPPQKEEILFIWEKWIEANPQSPFYSDWAEFAEQYDNQEDLYTETRVYIKKVSIELKELEIPPTIRQRVSKVLASVISIVLVILLALSRVARGSD